MYNTLYFQAGWASEASPNGILQKEGHTTLYLRDFSISTDVFSRKCLNNQCTKIWNGQNECIFRLSRHTCAGWEMGYHFVKAVNTSQQTFRGFVSVLNMFYNWHSCKFMSTPTFINWWFAWASAMNIDFREKCTHCGPSCVSLVCDGTKIGTGNI